MNVRGVGYTISSTLPAAGLFTICLYLSSRILRIISARWFKFHELEKQRFLNRYKRQT